MRDLEGRRERAQDAYLAGAFSVDELRGRQRQLNEAKKAVLREMNLCENRGEMLRKLVAYRDLLGKRADAWAASSRSSPTYRNTSRGHA